MCVRLAGGGVRGALLIRAGAQRAAPGDGTDGRAQRLAAERSGYALAVVGTVDRGENRIAGDLEAGRYEEALVPRGRAGIAALAAAEVVARRGGRERDAGVDLVELGIQVGDGVVSGFGQYHTVNIVSDKPITFHSTRWSDPSVTTDKVGVGTLYDYDRRAMVATTKHSYGSGPKVDTWVEIVETKTKTKKRRPGYSSGRTSDKPCGCRH